MSQKNGVFMRPGFPYTADISDEQIWSFVQRETRRDFPWLFTSGYPVVLAGLGRGWSGVRQRDRVISYAGWRATGWRYLDSVLAWLAHFWIALKVSRGTRVVGIAATPVSGFGIALARTLRKGKIRLIVRVQGHSSSRSLYVHKAKWRYKLLEWIEAFVLQRADLAVPMGKFTKDLALRKGVHPRKIVTLPFPVYWANSATVFPLPPQPTVLFVGRLEKEKGVHVLLEAIRIIKESAPPVRLFIAGDGSYRKVLESMVCQLDLSENVSFLGWIEASALQRAYKNSWVLVLPSILEEGLGMVLVEAGLMGRPVIGSNLGGIRDIIRHGYNGLLVPPEDPLKLANAILSVLKDPRLAHRMGRANLQVAKRYLEGREKALESVRLAALNLVKC